MCALQEASLDGRASPQKLKAMASVTKATRFQAISLDAAPLIAAERQDQLKNADVIVFCDSLDGSVAPDTLIIRLADLCVALATSVAAGSAGKVGPVAKTKTLIVLTDSFGECARATEHAGLWGMARSMQLEHPRLRIKCIDVEGGMGFSRDMLVMELKNNEFVRLVLTDQGLTRRVPRLVNAVHESTSTACPHSALVQGTYIITGGLGGLGLVAARTVARLGGKRPTHCAGV